jgi:hypothetical protein
MGKFAGQVPEAEDLEAGRIEKGPTSHPASSSSLLSPDLILRQIAPNVDFSSHLDWLVTHSFA